MATSRKTINWFEWARALGALAIVCLHAVVSTTNVPEIASANQALLYAENLAAIPLARWAVPVFFMVTGALLLDPAREMTLERVGRYLWRISFVLLTVGFVFCLMESASNDPTLLSAVPAAGADLAAHVAGLVGTSFLNLLSGDSWDHLWYLYALLGLYLMTPFLSAFVRRASRREELVACVTLYLVLCVAPTVNAVFDTKILSFLTVGSPVVYFLCGHYAWAYLELDRRIVLAAACSLAALAAIYVADPTLGGPLALPEYGFVLPLSLAVFLALRRWLDVPLDDHPAAALLARDSFGIYLFHPLFAHVALRVPALAQLPLAALQLVIVVSGVVGSILITRLLRLIPAFRNKL